MKKLMKFLTVLVVLVIGCLIAIPYFFKDDIIGIVQKQSDRYLKAELRIGDISLNMFKHFPNLNVTLENLTLSGKDRFSGDTIASIPLFEASVNLKSLISGNSLIINRILLEDCRIQAVVDTAGIANYDLLIAGEENAGEDKTTEESATPSASDKALVLNDIVIEDAFVSYMDYRNSNYASIGNINLELNGNLSGKETVLRLLLELEDISFRQRNSVWLNRLDLEWDTDIAADFESSKFKIIKNRLKLNDLQLDLSGSLAMEKDACNVDLALNAPDTKFASLLALVPETFQEYIKDLETSGEFKLDIQAKGKCDSLHLPRLDARLAINDAHIKYPDLPESINAINLDLHVTNPGSLVDSTAIDLNRLSFKMAGNPFGLQLHVLNPNDPLIKGKAKGTIDFASLKKALPMEDVQLAGRLTTDVTLNGRYSYIEKEEYEKFQANGNITLKDLRFTGKDFPEGLSIPGGSIEVSPARLRLDNLKAEVFSSDFLLKGYIANYLPYIFKGDVLKGDFTLLSERINLNRILMAQASDQAEKTEKTEKTPDSVTEGVLEIPRNMDVRFSARVGNVLFDHLNIRNINGDIRLNEAAARMKNLSMDLLKGQMVFNGEYNTADPKVPAVDFNLNISQLDINEAYRSFSFIRKSIPVAMNCEGKVSAKMRFAASLDQSMSPIMSTADGNGYLESQGILINNNPALNQLAGILKNDELSRLSISHLKIEFRMQDGNITVSPFKTNFAGNPITIYGSQTVDGKMDYTLSMNVKRSFFGKEINNMLKSIPGSENIKTLDLDVKVGGTLDRPSIRPDLSKAVKSVTKEAGKAMKGNLLNSLKGLFK